VKEILDRDLGFKKFTRRWVPHTISDPQKLKRVETSAELLQILNDLQTGSFDGITTGEESWFYYLYESSAMFAKSPGEVVPRTGKGIGVKKTMITILFTNRKLRIAKDLPKSQNYNQDYFLSKILPGLEREESRYERRKRDAIFYVHMDHSKGHGGGKIQEKFERKHLARAPHSAYSPDVSPCDFWFFGMAKEKCRIGNFTQFKIFSSV
jgi:histone-lysine N-methyltransferase SETMAR